MQYMLISRMKEENNMFGYESNKLLGINGFFRTDGEEGTLTDTDDGGYESYVPAYYVCSLFKVANGTVFINLPRQFLRQNPPNYINFCVDTDSTTLFLSFLEPLPEVPFYSRALQKSGKYNCQVRLPFPRELKGIFFPERYQRMTLTEVAKNFFKCEFCWERIDPARREPKQEPIYDGD